MLFGCDRAVNLEGRPCAVAADCIAGYACVESVCVRTGGAGDDDPDGIGSLTLGATFTIEAGSSLTDFPVYVPLDAAHVRAGATVESVRFVDVDTQRLVPFEIVHWEPSGTSEVWLQFASLDSVVHMQIGYASDSSAAGADNAWAQTGFGGVWHFASGADSSGVVGTLGTSPTLEDGSLGDAFAPATGETQSVTRSLDTEVMTVEAVLAPRPTSWTRKRTLTTTATAVDDQQVLFNAPLSGGRQVIDSVGDVVPQWTERSTATTEDVWLRIADTGTTSLTSYEGPAQQTPEAGPTVVLDNGLWATLWYLSGTPTTVSEMNAHFAGLSYGSAYAGFFNPASLGFDGQKCPNNGMGQFCNFSYLIEGWLIVPAGDYRFGTISDDASDILLGGTDWKNGTGASIVVDSYGTHGYPSDVPTSSVTTLTAAPVRFAYRFHQGTGDWGLYALYGPASKDPLEQSDVIPLSAFWGRHRVTPEPTTSAGEATLLGTFLEEADDFSLTAGPGLVSARVGDAMLSGGALADARLVTLVYAAGMATLYVDGVEVDSSVVQSLATGARDLRVGDTIDDAHAPSPLIDELRFSTTARDPAWIAAQARNVRGELVTF